MWNACWLTERRGGGGVEYCVGGGGRMRQEKGKFSLANFIYAIYPQWLIFGTPLSHTSRSTHSMFGWKLVIWLSGP
jgi:hypothetical protein